MSTVAILDNQNPDLFGQTPWQTVGPFFHYGLPWKGCADLVGASDLGARIDLISDGHYVMAEPTVKGPVAGLTIEIFGQVRDGQGQPVPDALVEIWQADADGRYGGDPKASSNLPGFTGFGRSSTSEDGMYRFRTVRPGPALSEGSPLAPHIAIGIQGRGLLKRLVTRLYFADAPENVADPILALVPLARRDTLIARRTEDGWRLDIVLQGAGETVFFDI
jgi:protocatechuate 3,4-dioxygenase alpha subunit